MHLPGSHGAADVTDDEVYLAISIRNIGPGLAVLNAWKLYPDCAHVIHSRSTCSTRMAREGSGWSPDSA
jgi:hypothetical protein